MVPLTLTPVKTEAVPFILTPVKTEAVPLTLTPVKTVTVPEALTPFKNVAEPVDLTPVKTDAVVFAPVTYVNVALVGTVPALHALALPTVVVVFVTVCP